MVVNLATHRETARIGVLVRQAVDRKNQFVIVQPKADKTG